MTLRLAQAEVAAAGAAMHALAQELFPLCRSITGNGLRATLRRLQQLVPLTLHEVPTGTAALDWTVPREWNIRGATIKRTSGETVVDFRNSSLHVWNYSAPINRRITRSELDQHLFSVPEHPDWIPYRTTYFNETWGFCLSDSQRRRLTDEAYDVAIEATLADGSLSYGEVVLPGTSPDEVLISTHCCHPALANDNLSGIVVATFLARRLATVAHRLTYRFVFAPGTIGAIVWLSRNAAAVARIRHGLTLACVGDAGAPHHKRSRRGDAAIDRAVAQVFAHRAGGGHVRDFIPYGYDERQYCSPGFDLPVGALTRTPHGEFPQYHTSADDLTLVRPEHLGDSLALCAEIADILERDLAYVNLNPCGEPQLGRRGLYRTLGGRVDQKAAELALLWVLNQSDAKHTLLDIAERSGLPFASLAEAADLLLSHGLLERRDERATGSGEPTTDPTTGGAQ